MAHQVSASVTSVLTLAENQHLEGKLFRLARGSTVRFVLGPSLLGRQVTVFTNSPVDGKPFSRSTYRQLSWSKEKSATFSGIVNSSNLFADLKLELPGSVHFYATVEDEVVGSGYFVVEPILTRGEDRADDIELNGIQCQTVLSKCLGPLNQWSQRILVAQRSGYNMIHFTPIQELGSSNSAYSLKNHFAVNPSFSYKDHDVGFEDIQKFVEMMRKEWKVLSITDIVLNHSANETPWIHDHPEVSYNLVNCPHLRPAFLLDRLLAQVTLDIEANRCRTLTNITSEEDFQLLREVIFKDYLPKVKLEEFFLFDTEDALQEFTRLLENTHENKESFQELLVVQDPQYRRMSCKVNSSSVISFIANRDRKQQSWKEDATKQFKVLLEGLKQRIINQVNDHLNSAVENVIKAARYERLEAKEKSVVTRSSPIITPYFTYSGPEGDFKEIESVMDDNSKSCFFMAHNGWVMDFDPLKNFANADCNVYLRRELIAWSDSVKLNYGDKPEDNPILWSMMKKYVEQTAQIFDGVRLDNCHSTPIHVAAYMLDAARAVRPNLYVIAELFTSSEETDNIFVNRLGINSLIRESMACKDSHDLGRLIHRFGGEPVGAFSQSNFRPLNPSFPHAIFFDATHDNESPVVKRSPYDLLPTAALISMSECATASNRGYDELVPHHIHVVNENRLYTSWGKDDDENINVISDPKVDSSFVDFHSGIIRAKQIINHQHLTLCQSGYREIFVDQVDPNVVAITRHNPQHHKSIVLVARTCFTKQDPAVTGFIRNIEIPGRINSILFEARMTGRPNVFEKNDKIINGLPDFRAEVRQNISPDKSNLITVTVGQGVNIVRFDKFAPGSVVCFDVSPNNHHRQAMQELKELSKDLLTPSKLGIDSIDLLGLNHALFKCHQEEKDEDAKSGVYNIPGFEDLTYAGLCGLMFHWRNIRSTNDLGHPICNNLRAGNWLPSYISRRLQRMDSTKTLGLWLENAFQKLDQIPRNLIPCYFDAIVTPIYTLLLERFFEQQSPFVSQGSHLIQRLALGSLALTGFNPTSALPYLSSSVSVKPPEIILNGTKYQFCSTIAAGLPHFASGYFRNWGRDTFIAIRGALMIPGRFLEAQRIILAFGGCIRHGLIPNLLDKGTNARFNCRDAVWFWLQAIKDYCNLAPNGQDILREPLRRLFPTDDAEGDFDRTIDQPLHQVMQEVLLRHFRGIDFMERNWGHKIDAHMTEAGFRVTVGVDRQTGFVFGGNKWNCGTWMDKMGSSSKAGNRGVPSSPRDGAAVEIVGLSYSVLSWLVVMQEKGVFPYECVADECCKWTWKDWSDKIKDNFDKFFFVGPDSRHPLINKRNIYKDTVGATEEWQDFQLRPNYAVAMSVAPDLFPVDHARTALDTFENVLLGPLGVKTLDPSDWNYRGDYDNSNDSSDPKIAHGFNYHQGPEWLWPLGYYLRARIHFTENLSREVTRIDQILGPHVNHLQSSPWFGLPELTNSNGSYCKDSCHNQAWSLSTLLDALYDLQEKLN